MSHISHLQRKPLISFLQRKPIAPYGKVHNITPMNAGWTYVGFQLYRLRPGDEVDFTNPRVKEVMLVIVEGKASFRVEGVDLGEHGDRMSVFERTPPHAIYTPPEVNWQATATTECTLAVCITTCIGGERQTQVLDPNELELEERGKGTNTRYIYNIAMEDRDVADRLLITEVFTPQGHWSSYPPHKHDFDSFPRITYLEEVYYYRLNPATGYAHQRIFGDDGVYFNENIAAADGDVVLVPKGYHPCAAPYGYDLYYLNVMAGPIRKWRFQNHPDYAWLYDRDNAE